MTLGDATNHTFKSNFIAMNMIQNSIKQLLYTEDIEGIV